MEKNKIKHKFKIRNYENVLILFCLFIYLFFKYNCLCILEVKFDDFNFIWNKKPLEYDENNNERLFIIIFFRRYLLFFMWKKNENG